MDNLHFIKMTINSVRMNGPDKDIGSRAAPEDIKKPEDKQALLKVNKLLGRGRGLVIMNRWRCTRSHPSSALGQQSGSLKSDHPSSTEQWATMLGRISFKEKWVNRELRNIWAESCYHRIECAAPNQLTALM